MVLHSIKATDGSGKNDDSGWASPHNVASENVSAISERTSFKGPPVDGAGLL